MPEYLFIYDHDILNGKEETNYDPTDAILFFYPPSTSVDFQLPLCSHVMGFCQILSNVFLSPPKQFTLESGATVYCVHEPSHGLFTKSEKRTITFALYSDDQINIKERCLFLYESFILYLNSCLSCTFKKGSRKTSKYLNSIIAQLLTILNRRDQMSLVFNCSPYCDPNSDSFKSMDSLFYQTVVNILDSIKNESQQFGIAVLGGSLFFKKTLIMSQFLGSFTNLFSVIIECLNGDSSKPQKELFSSVKKILVDTGKLQIKDGVHLFNVCVTEERYQQLANQSLEKNEPLGSRCCSTNSFHRMHLYIENHQNLILMFLLEDPEVNLSKETITMFSKLCNHQIGNIGDISTNISMSNTIERRTSAGQGNIWNIIFEDVDQSLNVTNSSQSQNISIDWEESLVKRVSALRTALVKEESIVEVQVKVHNEFTSAIRLGSQEFYTLKSSN